MNIGEDWQRWCLIGFALAGLASASATVWVRGAVPLGPGRLVGFPLFLWHILGRLNVLGSLTFGLFLAVCLWLFAGLRSIGKTIVFILASPAAAVLAVWAAVFMDGKFGIEPSGWEVAQDLRLHFIGGYVGGFLLSLSASWVVAQKISLLRHIAQSLCWAMGGGVLAAAGILAGSQFRDFFTRLSPGHPAYDTSLLLVWHTGVAVLLGLQLWAERNNALLKQFLDK